MLRWAAEHGFDRLAWTTGEQQADRYDLSKRIDRLAWIHYADDDTYGLSGYKVQTNVFSQIVPAADLEEWVGRDLATRMRAGEGTPSRTDPRQRLTPSPTDPHFREISGLSLRVGGEWARRLYDQMIPQAVNKIAKPWGARAGTTTLPAGKRWSVWRTDTDEVLGLWDTRAEAARDQDSFEREGIPTRLVESTEAAAAGGAFVAHSVDITPAMRGEIVGRGLALFEPTIEYRPGAPEPSPREERRGPGAQRAQAMSDRLRDLVAEATGLNEQARRLIPETETIRETGTISPEQREPFREEGEKPETFAARFSEKDIAAIQARLVVLGRDYALLRREMEDAADPFAAHTARTGEDLLAAATAGLNQAAIQFRKLRFAAGRAVKRFDRPVPEDVILALQQAGVMTDWLKHAKPRLPIYTNILKSLRAPGNLRDPAERRQFIRDVVDAWRLNLFAVTSWTLDLIGNASEIGAQVTGGVGRDVVHLAQGRATFPSLQGWFQAIRDRAVRIGQPTIDRIEEGLGTSIGGERIRGGFRGALRGEPGTFTTRETTPAKFMDLLVGSPLYAKGVFDLGAKRLAATATLWREAIEEADRRGIAGRLERRRFIRRFLSDPSPQAEARAVAQGRKAGFDRPLTEIEESLARSTLVRLIGDVFARWPFQFTRTMGEWLGADPEFYRRVVAKQVTAADWGEWFAKAAAGWLGLYLLDDWLYDRVDFQSMEYVHEDGSRTRLSNRDPIPTALWLAAVLRGDEARATAALRNASIPGARLLAGEGGLLGGIISTAVRAISNADVDARALGRELTDMVNRAIPGQALLSALKTVFDPTVREGVGANIPGVSRLLPHAVARTTGEPLRPRQRIPGLGLELPAIGGTPIPGAQRLLDPVERLLSRYGLLIYRGPRQPIAGTYPADVPEDIYREWLEEFGHTRNNLLSPLAKRMDEGKLERMNSDVMRQMIQNLDARAALAATHAINRRHRVRGRLPKRPTVRERRGPAVFERRPEERRREPAGAR